MKLLVLFASFDGQTARIAERIAATIAALGHETTLRSAQAPDAWRRIAEHDAVIIGGAIRYGRFAPFLETSVRAHAKAIAARPNAFFSVSLSARAGGDPREVNRYLEQFCAGAGWHPRVTASFAGALRYRKYNPFLRLVMRFISGMAGGDQDTSRDHEYTDWQAVDRFAVQFAAGLRLPVAA